MTEKTTLLEVSRNGDRNGDRIEFSDWSDGVTVVVEQATVGECCMFVLTYAEAAALAEKLAACAIKP